MKMKNIGCIALLLAFVSAGWGQRKPNPKDSIWVGMDLQLGLPKDFVMSRLAGGYNLVKIGVDEDNWLVNSKSEPIVNYGNQAFCGGKLCLAEKNWSDSVEDDFSFARALHGALEQFGREGRHVCSVTTSSDRTPTADMQSVTLTCGSKYLVIDTTEILSGQGKGKSTTIQELLASDPPSH